MKTHILTRYAFVLLLAGLFGVAGCASQQYLAKHAKISKEEAMKTAQAKVPDGALKESEIEKEDGKVVWCFEFTRPNTTDLTEVVVDANTGEVVGVEVEPVSGDKKKSKSKSEKKAAGTNAVSKPVTQ